MIAAVSPATRQYGHRRLRVAPATLGEQQAGGVEEKGSGVPIQPGSGGGRSSNDSWMAPMATRPWPPSHLYPLDTTRSASPTAAASIGSAPASWDASITSRAPTASVAARPRHIDTTAGGVLHRANGDDRRRLVHRGDDGIGQVRGRRVEHEVDGRPASILGQQPRAGHRREVGGDQHHGAVHGRCQQQRRLTQELAGPGQRRDLALIGAQRRRRLGSQGPEVGRLVLVAEVQVAVTADVVEESVHGLDRRATHEPECRLVEVDRFAEAGVVGTRQHRRQKVLVVSRPIHD